MTSPAPSAGSAAPPSSTTIVVIGDVIRDLYVYQGDRIHPAQPGKIAPHFSDQAGGAKALYDLLAAARPDGVAWGFRETISLEALRPVHTLWTACEGGTRKQHEDAGKDDKPKKVWRVGQALGYGLGTQAGTPPKSAAADEPHRVLVIDDAGLSFRTKPAAGSWPRGVSHSDPQPAWIIYKTANPVAQGDLWRTIIGGSNPKRRDNLIVIVAADELRRAGAAISRGFSWERTLSELCGELNHNPLFQPLLRFSRRLVVNFGCVGAVWFADAPEQPDAAAQDRATLVYDPTLPEGGWKTLLADDHVVYGHLNAFTAAITLGAADAPADPPLDLTAAIECGLAACRQLRLSGHGLVSDKTKPGAPLADLRPLLSPNPADPIAIKARKELIPQGFQVVCGACGGGGGEATTWTLAALAENPPDQQRLPLYGLAHRVALYGHTELRSVPHAYFGSLLSVDRPEIETLRSLMQLIKRYEQEKQPKQPLSIAAFGPPGAGKSFGIKEIARQVLGKDVPLEFNLSQFDAASGLHGAFHQVRDRALKGITPVVFWDEFDARDYMWLQYLLGPMQDATFEENGHTHNIGKCIFVFAGATSWDFEHFGPAPMPRGWQEYCRDRQNGSETNRGGSDPEHPAEQLEKFYKHHHPDRAKDEQAANEDFRRKKGPDFLSRLDGHIDVLGPNQRLKYNWSTRCWDRPDPHDITFPVRRALLLRQFLGVKKPQETLAIDRDLLRAFLHVPRYRHGARSLEKIAKPLALSHLPFRRAHLPPPQVLAQHLDSAEEFDRIYQETQHLLTPDAIESLAVAIHDDYKHRTGSKDPFTKLDPFSQQSNRAAALRIPHILALAGLCLVRRQPQQSKLTLDKPLTPEEQAVLAHLEKHIEVLAEEEHRLWVQFHVENGWTYGYKMQPKVNPGDPDKPAVPFEKDKANLRHPCLQPFHEMPDDHGQRKTWQDYDRDAIRRYPHLLRLTDFEIRFIMR